MHQQFADWYALSKVQPTPEQLKARWQGVESLVKSATKKDLLVLVLAACGQRPENDEVWRPLQQHFKSTDDSYRFGAEYEFRVLAAATLGTLFDTPGRTGLATLSALALRTAAFLKWKSVIPELSSNANRFLLSRAVEVRRPTAIPGSDALGGGVKKNLEAVTSRASEGVPIQLEALSGAIKDLAADDLRLQRRATGVADSLEVRYRVAEEQLAILWWLFAEHSLTVDKPFASCGGSTVLLAASELAGLTRFVPGPAATTHFLRRILKVANVERKTSVTRSVAATTQDWRRSQQSVSDALIPVMPIAAQIGASEPRTPADSDPTNISALEVSGQYYNEILTQRQFELEGGS